MPTSLAELRARAGISREDLARKCELDEDTLGRIERGSRQSYQARTIRRIAEALSVRPGEVAEFAHLVPPMPSRSDGPHPLREWRRAACLSVGDLAGLTGVPYSTLALIEASGAPPVVTAYMKRLRRCLG